MKKSPKKKFPCVYIRNLEIFQAELNFREKSWKISKITDLPPISLLRHSKGLRDLAANLTFAQFGLKNIEIQDDIVRG